MKKMMFLGLIAIMLLFIACNDGNDTGGTLDEPHGNKDMIEGGQPTPQVVAGIEEFQDKLDLPELLQVRPNRTSKGLILVDLLTNDVSAEIEFLFKEDQMVRNVYEFPNGYYGALAMSGAEIVRDEDGQVANVSGGGHASLSFFLFDSELELVQEFEITDEEIALLFNHAVTFIDDELLIYYHMPTYMSDEGLYIYNMMDNSKKLVNMDLDEEIVINRLEPTANSNQLAFMGTRLNDEIHTYYGVINLETGEVQYSRTDFSIASIIVSGTHFLLTENPPPAFQGGTPESKVIVFNMVTGEEHMVQLDGNESANAMVIGNRYVLTGSHEQIRLYDIQTSELVLERVPSVEMLPQVDDIIDSEGELVEGVHPHISAFLTISEGVYGVLFDIGDGTAHIEFIVID